MDPTDSSPADRHVERRRGERRRARRAGAVPASDDDSWFGILGLAADTQQRAADDPADGSGAAARAADGRRMLTRQARRMIQDPESAPVRIHRTYATARAAIGIALAGGMLMPQVVGLRASPLLVALCLAYALQTLAVWWWPRLGGLVAQPDGQGALRPRHVWLAVIGVDLLMFGTVYLLVADTSVNFMPLLALPVMMAGVVSARLVALATAAGVTLILLATAWLASDTGGAALLTQAGLVGMGLFLVALLSSELAGRLAREELAARNSMALARQQVQLNRLMIDEIADGVLVVDRSLRVRAANPAARALLAVHGQGPAAPFGLQGHDEWRTLTEAVQRALTESYWPEAGADVLLRFAPGDTRTLRMRVRFTRRPGAAQAAARGAAQGDDGGEPLAVLLLEDVRTAQARLRQEKLAAMGRVSAAVAHEIRNPLAAIAQANALLLEDPLPPAQQRLAQMVADNAQRLRRVVDDVMELSSAGAPPERRRVDARAEVADAAAEWARTAGVEAGEGGRLRLDLPDGALPAWFDRDHLRRVLVNLLDNALRHSSGAPGAIDVRLTAVDAQQLLLRVASDGAAIAPEVERHLFEPFYSTHSRGTGLGLYICRELCERYGASIEYRLRPDGQRNLFLVTMRRGVFAPDRTQTA